LGERQGSLLRGELLTQLDRLAEKWRNHSVADLQLRHETGVWLNDHYGNPNSKRQTYGEGEMEGVAERLGIDVSDLSRMRRFAHHFKSLNDLELAHPKVTTWSGVRKLLPTLRATGKGDGQSTENTSSKASRRKSSAQVRGVKQSLSHLSQRLREVREDLSYEDRKELLAYFEALARAVGDCLRVRVRLESAGEKETRPPSERAVTAEAGNTAEV